MSHIGNYKMYSISKAAKEMHLGKDTLYGLIQEGRIGTIKVRKREKIPASEIERFLSENTHRKSTNLVSRKILQSQTAKIESKSLFRAIKEEILDGEHL